MHQVPGDGLLGLAIWMVDHGVRRVGAAEGAIEVVDRHDVREWGKPRSTAHRPAETCRGLSRSSDEGGQVAAVTRMTLVDRKALRWWATRRSAQG